MENKLVEDELNYEEINNVKGLKYKLISLNTKVSEDPIVKKWLSAEKLSKGDNGITCYCRKCNLIFYFQNENELKETKKKCCSLFHYAYICNYCGKIFVTSSLCCIKNSIKVSFEIILEDTPFLLFFILFPNISCFIFFCTLYRALFYGRRTKIENDKLSAYGDKDTKLSTLIMMISCFSLLLFSFIYTFPFLVSNIVFLIVLLRNKFSKGKKQSYISYQRYI